MKRIYLDAAAATPVDQRVLDAMLPYFSDTFHNPSALYEGARAAKSALEDARGSVAQTIGARPSEIIFTAGGTESANLAIEGVMQIYSDAEILLISVEHDAVYRTAQKFNNTLVDVDETGRLKLDDLEQKISDKTVLISVMLANNEVGTLQPVKEVVQLVEKVKKQRKQAKNQLPLYVHTDACQAPLYSDVHVARLGVDMMTLNGGKIHGPKQSGLLYVKAGTRIGPLISGGGQEWGYRSGTENVAFAVGFAKALSLSEKSKHDRLKQVTEVREYFMEQLEKIGGEINGHRKLRLANNVHVTFSGVDNERVLFALDDAGVDAAAGSACSASSDTSSRVLRAMGASDEYARSSLRFSLLQTATKTDVDEAIKRLKKSLQA